VTNKKVLITFDSRTVFTLKIHRTKCSRVELKVPAKNAFEFPAKTDTEPPKAPDKKISTPKQTRLSSSSSSSSDELEQVIYLIPNF